jgi:deoxycytidylate deaminase/uncharacterized protein YeaO (DUF488 family)
MSKNLEEELDPYYLVQSYEVSKSSPEKGFTVGCIIVKDNKIISTGFNRILDGDEYNLSIHAECEAIAKCARKGTSTENSTLYCNLQPCPDCAKLIVSSKIKRVVYGMNYSTRRYKIVDEESYNRRRDNKEPVLVEFSHENSEKIFENNGVELKYMDIFGLIWELDHQKEADIINRLDPTYMDRMINSESLDEDEIRGLMNIRNMVGKKIYIQPIYSNDEVGDNCSIVVTDLHDNNDICDIIHGVGKENTKITKDVMIELLRITKNEKLRKELLENIELFDEFESMYEEEFGYNNEDEKKCKFFILGIRPDKKVELRRMDTREYIDIKGIDDLFDVLKDDKYEFIY